MKIYVNGNFLIFIDSNNSVWVDNLENVVLNKSTPTSTNYNLNLLGQRKIFTGLSFSSITDESGTPYSSQTAFETFIYANTGNRISSGSTGTNLSYTPSPTGGTVYSDTGNDAVLTLADSTNAGLLKPSDYIKLLNTSGTNTGDETIYSIISKLGYTPENTSNKVTDLSTNDNTHFPTTQAVQSAITSAVTGLLNYRSGYDASVNLYPSSGGSGTSGAIKKGDFWFVTVAGTLGTTVVKVGDMVVSNTNTPGQTSSNWDLIGAELGYTPENVANKTTTMTGNTTSNVLYLTCKAVYDWATGLFAQLSGAAFTGSISATNLSGTNTGNETTSSIGSLINGSASAVPNDTDLFSVADTSVLKKLSGTNLKAYLKLYFDTLYSTTSIMPLNTPHETFRGVQYANNSTTETTYGGIVISTSASTLARSVSTTNYASKQIRKGFVQSVVSSGHYADTKGSALLWYISGGFRFVCDIYISDTAYASGCRQFYGMYGSTSSLTYSDTVTVDSMINLVGFGSDASDTNLQLMYNDATGTASRIDLGSSFPSNRSSGAALTSMYSLELYNGYDGNVIYKATNNETGFTVQGTISTNLPSTTQGLNFIASRCMGGAGGVTNSGQFDLGILGVYSI